MWIPCRYPAQLADWTKSLMYSTSLQNTSQWAGLAQGWGSIHRVDKSGRDWNLGLL